MRKHAAAAVTGGVEPFNSRIMQYFLESLHWSRNSRVLDIGPVCGNNVTCLAEHFRRLYVFNAFARLHACLQAAPPLNEPLGEFDELWRDFDYGRNAFDGILLWHIGDYLADEALVRLGAICHHLLKPAGLVALYSCDRPLFEGVCGFRMLEACHLQPYPIPSLNLPQYHRSNRELISILKNFSMLRSFIYRNGVREFAFRRK